MSGSGSVIAAHLLADRARRSVKRLLRPRWMRQLESANREATEPVIAAGGPVVSLTTHGVRLNDVFYAIESIAAGREKPSRLALWIDETLLASGLPDSLQRLQQRGLEVHGCTDLGPHTKYFPQVLAEPSPRAPLVTADDDQLYPDDWLQRLSAAHRAQPDMIHCYRAERIGLLPGEGFVPYRQWAHVQGTRPSHLNFLTGVSGVIYPLEMQNALRRRGTEFVALTPRNDDIWLNAVALDEGLPVRQIVPTARAFYEIPGSRAQGLARFNYDGGGSDAQMRATYSAQAEARLRALQAAERP